jgi:hypothetical protein
MSSLTIKGLGAFGFLSWAGTSIVHPLKSFPLNRDSEKRTPDEIRVRNIKVLDLFM